MEVHVGGVGGGGGDSKKLLLPGSPFNVKTIIDGRKNIFELPISQRCIKF